MSAAPPDPADTNLHGCYAGAASRLAAYLIDAAVSSGAFVVGLAVAAYAVDVITGRSVSWSKQNAVTAVIFICWQFVYYAYSWGVAGRTVGMALLGLRVVRRTGEAIGARTAIIRTLAFPLSFLFFGLGFLGILVRRDRRALHDLIARTAVIYDWDARVARFRRRAQRAASSPGQVPAESPGEAGGSRAGGSRAGGSRAGGSRAGGSRAGAPQ